MQVKIFLQYILFIPPFMTLYSFVTLHETLGNTIKNGLYATLCATARLNS